MFGGLASKIGSRSSGPVYSTKGYTRLWAVTTKPSGNVTGSATTDTGQYSVKWWDGTTSNYNSGDTFSKAAAGGSRDFEIYPSNYVLTEESSNSFVAVNSGPGAQISTAQKKFGNSSYYASGASFLNIKTTGEEFNFGSGNFTVEFWLKWDSGSAGEQTVISTAYPTDQHGIWIGISGGRIRWLIGDGTWRVDRYTNSYVNTGAWFHVALVRNGNAYNLYVNGTSVDSVTNSTTLTNTNKAIVVGGRPSASQYFKGWLDGVRVVKGSAVYTANFTAPTSAPTAITNTVLLMNFESAFTVEYGGKTDVSTELLLNFNGANNSTTTSDASYKNRTVTFNGGAKISTTQSKFGGSSLYLDGTGDYLTLTSDAGFRFDDDFTIEGWFYFNVNNVGYQPLVMAYTTADQTAFILYIENNNSLYFDISNGSSWSTIVSSTATPSVSQWSHIAVSRRGLLVQLFLNGTLVGSKYSGDVVPPGTTLAIGHYPYFPQGALQFNGYIDSIRIIKGISLYAKDFTLPAIEPSIYASTTIYNAIFDGFDVSNNSLTKLRAENVFLDAAQGFFTWQQIWVGYPYYYWQWQQNYIPGLAENGDLSYNQLASVDLDQFYTDLLLGTGDIFVQNNTGADADSPSIATSKGYTVFGSTAPSTSLLLNFNGSNGATTTTDESSNNHAVNFGSNTQISTTQSKFGASSLYVNGGRITINSHASLNLTGETDFTIEMWIYATANSSTWLTVLARRSGGWQYQIGTGYQSTRFYYFGNNDIAGIDTTNTGPYLSLNQWTHVAAVVKAQKGQLFVNGTLAGTCDWPNYPDTGDPLIIGSNTDSGNEYFYGYIDNLRIVKGAAIYLENFTPPTSPVSLYP